MSKANKVIVDPRFDNCSHWLMYDRRNSRSLCKMPKCGMLTHAFCSKCNKHLCFNRDRNCFRQYHVPIDQTTQVDGKPLNDNNTQRENLQHLKKIQVEEIPFIKGKQLWAVNLINSNSSKVLADKTKKRIKNRREKGKAKSVESYNNTRVLRKRVIFLSDAGRLQNIKEVGNVSSSSFALTVQPLIQSQLTQNNGNSELKTQYFSYLRLLPQIST